MLCAAGLQIPVFRTPVQQVHDMEWWSKSCSGSTTDEVSSSSFNVLKNGYDDKDGSLKVGERGDM